MSVQVKYVFLPNNHNKCGGAEHSAQLETTSTAENSAGFMESEKELLKSIAAECDETGGFVELYSIADESRRYFYNNNICALFGDFSCEISHNPRNMSKIGGLLYFCNWSDVRDCSGMEGGRMYYSGTVTVGEGAMQRAVDVAAKSEHDIIIDKNQYTSNRAAKRYGWSSKLLSQFTAVSAEGEINLFFEGEPVSYSYSRDGVNLNGGELISYESPIYFMPIIRMKESLQDYADAGVGELIRRICQAENLLPAAAKKLFNSGTSISEFRQHWLNDENAVYIEGIPDSGDASDNRSPSMKESFEPEKLSPDSDELRDIKKYYMECEMRKFDTAKIYGKEIFAPNEGHYGLWEIACQRFEDLPPRSDGKYYDVTDCEIFARDPVEFVPKNRGARVVGIDFGTYGTVAGISDGREIKFINMFPERGDYTQFENPTILNYKNRKKFEEDYHSSEFFPDTELNDIGISYAAKGEFEMRTKDKNYLQYVVNLKRWAKDPNMILEIKDARGVYKKIGSYHDINSTDEQDFVDPIEIYAYYLGLFINRMKENSICFKYLLSYSATYPTNVREKICQSFERGIKKSLPKSIAENKKLMRGFSVKLACDEATAYAVAASRRYLTRPENISQDVRYRDAVIQHENFLNDVRSNEIFMGVYDLGGGTLDYSFLTFRYRDRKFLYKRLETGGVSWFGCENILELLAFDIFKKNRRILIEKNAKCTIPWNMSESADESFVGTSNQAHFNTIFLVSELRKIWIGPQGSDDYDVEEETLKEISEFFLNGLHCENDTGDADIGVQTDDNDIGIDIDIDVDIDMDTDTDSDIDEGADITAIVDIKYINDFFSESIRKGVKGFFDLMREVVDSYEGLEGKKCYVFLAGNASKGKRVKAAFEEYIENSESGDELRNNIVIHAPLPTISDEKEIAEKNSSNLPTAKTGVVYGMLASSTSEFIKLEQQKDLSFSYHIGCKEEDIMEEWKVWFETTITADELSESDDRYRSIRSIHIEEDSTDVLSYMIGCTSDDWYKPKRTVHEDLRGLTFINIDVDALELPEDYIGRLYLCCKKADADSTGTVEIAVSKEENSNHAVAIGICNLDRAEFEPYEEYVERHPGKIEQKTEEKENNVDTSGDTGNIAGTPNKFSITVK